jgi:hypothetical protein
MNRRDYYFRQLVTEAELDDGFEQAEQADRAIMTDLGLVGIVNGLAVSEHTPTKDLTVFVSSGVAYDQNGQRCAIVSTQNPDLSIDSLDVSTAVTTPGNEKYLSLFVKFARALSDPRLDGNNLTVYFVRAESFTLWKVQGSEAPEDTAVPPALLSSGILLADILIYYGTTQIDDDYINSGINIDVRRQMAFMFSSGTHYVNEGTPEESDAAVLAEALAGVAAHEADPLAAHAATAISYAGSGAWYDEPGISATNIEAAIDEVVYDLIQTSTGNSGSGHLGAEAIPVAFTDAPHTLSVGSIRDQLAALLGYVDEPARTRSVTATFTFNSPNKDGTVFFKTNGGAFSGNLPNPALWKGQRILLVDTIGSCSTNPLTLVHYGSTKINNTVGDLALYADFGQWWIESDGTDWFVA